MRFTLTRWRFLLLAAFVLLAAAMGGGDGVARPGLAPALSDCREQGGCDQRLTTPAQPALIQAALRIDGKALTGGATGGVALPHQISLYHPSHDASADPVAIDTPRTRRVVAGPGQPRGPPIGR